MKCKIKLKDKDSGFISESLFDYPVNEKTIDSVAIKRAKEHMTMTIRLKAWMGNPFDLFVICTGIPADISPSVACLPVGVAIDRPRSVADSAMSCYTAIPIMTDDEAQLLARMYLANKEGDDVNAR